MKLIFERSRMGRRCSEPPRYDKSVKVEIPGALRRREAPRLPELSEADIVRHYMELSRNAFGVDNGFYPLGSCTMKYNPRADEAAAALPGFGGIHPLTDEEDAQGCLEVMYELKSALCGVTGMDEFTLSPAAGAQGEYTGLSMIRAYFAKRGEKRTKVIVPDSAHGTNPASAAMNGFTVVNIPSTKEGLVDLDALGAAVGDDTAALMLTNPNTLGLFDTNIERIAQIVHGAGGLLYYDGANLNAVMGICRPGEMGFDVMHINLHKTFATPHGGGGPGSGPVGCKAFLRPFLPVPVVERSEAGEYSLRFDLPDSIGRVRSFYGNFLVCVKALCYIKMLGEQGLRDASLSAVINANYMRGKLQEYSDLVYSKPCMHEFVLSLESLKKRTGVSALDVAKALLDCGVHPPTMYFPTIVHEALMIEPTETESVETMDSFIAALTDIFSRAETSPEEVKRRPVGTEVKRLNETEAARRPVLRYPFD